MEKDNIISCSSLEEVRSNIDQIDTELVKLIAKRSKYVTQTVQFKKSATEIINTDRLNTIVDKVKSLSEEADLNPLLAEKIYRTLVNAFISEELYAFDSTLYRKVEQSYY